MSPPQSPSPPPPPPPPPQGAADNEYYTAGNTELATETPLTVRRLETRRQLTKNSNRLVIALVGLPARGKSFVARKMVHFLNWSGIHCKIFNVGRYRREAVASLQQQHADTTTTTTATTHIDNNNDDKSSSSDDQNQDQHDGQDSELRDKIGACDADFFAKSNESANVLRQKVAEVALNDMLRWLDEVDDDDVKGQGRADYDLDELSDDAGNGTDGFSSDQPPTDQHRRDRRRRHHGRGKGRRGDRRGSSGKSKLDYRRRDRIAIFDATNSTNQRRQWILEKCTAAERDGKEIGVVFVESVCDDQELLDENYRYKVSSSPDFKGMPLEDAISDLKRRVENYELQYETINNDNLSYIKIFNLSTKLMVNHIYGRMAKELVPALMAWNIGTRPVFLCRPGETLKGILTDGEDYVTQQQPNRTAGVNNNNNQHIATSSSSSIGSDTSSSSSSAESWTNGNSYNSRGSGYSTKKKPWHGDHLGPNGIEFRERLLSYCYDEVHAYMSKRASVHDMTYTGTSLSALKPDSAALYQSGSRDGKDPFPMKILSSTMPRAVETVSWWDEYEFTINELSSLNPLDKGDFVGMELDEIQKANPAWYEKLKHDTFRTRFPEGECYEDLIRRLTSVVIDVEQQVIPVLVVSHVSILQSLIAYFRSTPVEECMSIEVPMHTVIKFTPVRGGGWSESQHPLLTPPTAVTSTTTDILDPPPSPLLSVSPPPTASPPPLTTTMIADSTQTSSTTTRTTATEENLSANANTAAAVAASAMSSSSSIGGQQQQHQRVGVSTCQQEAKQQPPPPPPPATMDEAIDDNDCSPIWGDRNPIVRRTSAASSRLISGRN